MVGVLSASQAFTYANAFYSSVVKVAQGWSHYFHPTKTSTRSDTAINSGFGLDVKRIQVIRISFR